MHRQESKWWQKERTTTGVSIEATLTLLCLHPVPWRSEDSKSTRGESHVLVGFRYVVSTLPQCCMLPVVPHPETCQKHPNLQLLNHARGTTISTSTLAEPRKPRLPSWFRKLSLHELADCLRCCM